MQKKGKDAVEAFREFFLLKADATFCNFFLHKYELNDQIDNTPKHLRKAPADQKRKYLHQMVAEALQDLMPYFKDAKIGCSLLADFPLSAGRRKEDQTEPNSNICTDVLETQSVIDSEIVEAIATQIQHKDDHQILIEKHLVESSSPVSSSRNRKLFSCSICSYESKYEAICISHIEMCLEKLSLGEEKLGQDYIYSTCSRFIQHVQI